MNIDSSIKPMPTRRAERSSLKAEIFVNRFMCDSLRKGRQGSLIRLLKMSPASFPDVQVHIVDAPPNSGLPEFGNIVVQVGNSRLGCAGPESILPAVVMDSGLARSLSSGRALRGPVGAPRNDGHRRAPPHRPRGSVNLGLIPAN